MLLTILTGALVKSLILHISAWAEAQRPLLWILSTKRSIPLGGYPNLFSTREVSSLILLPSTPITSWTLVALILISVLTGVTLISIPAYPYSSASLIYFFIISYSPKKKEKSVHYLQLKRGPSQGSCGAQRGKHHRQRTKNMNGGRNKKKISYVLWIFIFFFCW